MRAADDGRAVERAIAGLHQRRLRQRAVRAIGLRAEVVNRRYFAARRHLENGSSADAAAVIGFAIEVSIRALDQKLRVCSIRAIRLSAKTVKNLLSALPRNFEDGAFIIRPAISGCAVKIAVCALDHRREHVVAVGSVECDDGFGGLS